MPRQEKGLEECQTQCQGEQCLGKGLNVEKCEAVTAGLGDQYEWSEVVRVCFAGLGACAGVPVDVWACCRRGVQAWGVGSVAVRG